ncbi:PREDICTED: BTB/POZ domain-containing protein At5g17580-like [Ipomoea nil]|uniref:BTB/POZ domain-containing protein At5g17580-like n=1 Tax=Ipomoea nil TaxID=35883 RepID=UPI000901EBDE|nr:PREDICTED: BTB/POZ domain-containing protein At5g17580-like [Ipomoea nil]
MFHFNFLSLFGFSFCFVLFLRFRKPSKNAASVLQIRVCGVTCSVNRELLAENCARVAAVLRENPQDNLSLLLGEIPADPQTFEVVARFCHGLEIELSTENVVHVCCLAYYLGMTEDQRTNNLLKRALVYFQHNVVPSWNKSIRALKTMENVLQQAIEIGLVDGCAESLVAQALDDPRLLGEPVEIDGCGGEENGLKPSARRKLFDIEWKSEDLTVLAIGLYEPIISAMIHRQVPPEYVAASLCQYVKNWIFSDGKRGDNINNSTMYKKSSEREVIEAIQRLLPDEKGLISCRSLFEMLQSAIALGASVECKDGLELRIGKQLDLATVQDLLKLCQLYTKDEKYDAECVKRILKNYYCNYTSSDISGLIAVAELIDEFLAEVSRDTEMNATTFVSLAELSASVSTETKGSSDGIYRAVDIYLDKHRWLTESDREEVCSVLDCNKMSPEAREHAAQNQRLPLRLVVQVLFVGQLKLRDTITKGAESSDRGLVKLEEEHEEEAPRAGRVEEEVKEEMQKMSNKVSELERECTEMKEIQRSCCNKAVKEKGSMWREMKRKLGCMTTMHDCNCHVKKKKTQSKNVK